MEYLIKEITPFSGKYIVKASELSTGESRTWLVAREFSENVVLSEGEVISDEAACELSDAERLTEAASKALDALSYSTLSRSALVSKLRVKYGFEKEISERAAQYAVSKGYIDEAAQAELFASRAVRTKKWGKRRIVAELCAKGYPKNTAERAACTVSDGEYLEALRSLAGKKKTIAAKNAEQYRKTAASLLRLGHSPSDIKKVMAELREHGAEE